MGKWIIYARRNLVTALLLAILGIVLFVPGAKALLLKTFIHTGLFNAPAKTAVIVPAAEVQEMVFINEKGAQRSSAALKGKIIFINVWAVWCPPCVAEMGTINKLYNKVKADKRIVFILADADNNLPAALSFMQKNGYDLPVYQLGNPLPGNLYSGTIPTTLIIDHAGNIVQKHEGIANYDTADMLELLTNLANASSAAR